MKNEGYFFRISFLLLALVLVRVASLHAYIHAGSDTAVEQCTVCDVALENQQPQLVTGTDYELSSFTVRTVSTINEAHQIATYYQQLLFSLFERPPPLIG